MKRTSKLALNRTTIRQLDNDQLEGAVGGSNTLGSSGTSVISASGGASGPSVIQPTIRQTIGTSGTSVISAGGGH